MENWAGEPEVIKQYAKHYQTGEAMPDELIENSQTAVISTKDLQLLNMLLHLY